MFQRSGREREPAERRMALTIARDQIVRFRRRVTALDERIPMSQSSLRRAAWAGLQDSMPRAALLSIHARVADTPASILDDPTLIQVRGPRFSVYAVAAVDMPVFTVSRYPDDAAAQVRAERAAATLHELLAGERAGYGDAGDALGVNANSLRYGTATGTIAIRWAGARQPVVWTVPRPEMDPLQARLEMARRYLHVFGPTNAASFAEWAGIPTRSGFAAFAALEREVIRVTTPVGEASLLAADEATMRTAADEAAAARLLPSGDTLFLLWGRDRELLVPDERQRAQLWTTRVWPGALLVGGEISGVWRRANEKVQIDTWRPLTSSEKEAVELEARSLPLPGLTRPISVSFCQAA